jgi:ABC-type dipeptide/oligopeptide/nickel transport system permease subunit
LQAYIVASGYGYSLERTKGMYLLIILAIGIILGLLAGIFGGEF